MSGRVAAGDDQAVEVVGPEVVHVGVHRERIAALALVGSLAGAGNDGPRAFLLQADLGVPELEIFVQRAGEEEDVRAVQRHGGLGRQKTKAGAGRPGRVR